MLYVTFYFILFYRYVLLFSVSVCMYLHFIIILMKRLFSQRIHFRVRFIECMIYANRM